MTLLHELNKLLADNDLLDAEFLANKFWSMDSSQQAKFFNHLAVITKDHEPSAVFQWSYMRKYLTSEGKDVLDDIKNHTDN